MLTVTLLHHHHHNLSCTAAAVSKLRQYQYYFLSSFISYLPEQLRDWNAVHKSEQ